METHNSLFVWFFLLGILLFIPLIIKIVSFFNNFREENEFICMNMDRAASFEEYRYWRRELRCHYLYLIPFVDKRNIKKVYRFFFKPLKEDEERRDGILMLIAPSVLSILCCFICLVGMTWAWFSASSESGSLTIRSASYMVSSVVIDDSGMLDMNTDGSYTLDAGTRYTITLMASGTASTGFCVVSFDDSEINTTAQIEPDSIFTFCFTPSSGGRLKLTGQWGINPSPDIENNGEIGDASITLPPESSTDEPDITSTEDTTDVTEITTSADTAEVTDLTMSTDATEETDITTSADTTGMPQP